MGHIRTGRLPKVRGWPQVIKHLSTEGGSASDLAAATTKAAKEFLEQLGTDASLGFCYWLLTQITYRARSTEFPAMLQEIGLDISDKESALDFLTTVSEYAQSQIKLRKETFPTSEIVQLSLREVLTETIGEESRSLFGTTQEDVRLACSRYSSPRQFASLARLYLSKVMNRSIQFFVSKESYNHVGHGRRFNDISELTEFTNVLETYCYQSAKIVEDFAGGWYSKRNWLGEITESEAQSFVYIATKKLREEICREESPPESKR